MNPKPHKLSWKFLVTIFLWYNCSVSVKLAYLWEESRYVLNVSCVWFRFVKSVEKRASVAVCAIVISRHRHTPVFAQFRA